MQHAPAIPNQRVVSTLSGLWQHVIVTRWILTLLFGFVSCGPSQIGSSDAPPEISVDAGDAGITDGSPDPPDAAVADAADGGAMTLGDANIPDAATADADVPDAAVPAPLRVLLFTRTTGFRHGSIGSAVDALTSMGQAEGWSVTASEDPTLFSTAGLENFDVVVFLLTTGDILDGGQQAAFESFVQGGGGWVGVHSASDTEYDWAWYGGLLGAYFDGHPRPQDARIDVVDATHPAMVGIPAVWERFDEWYNFRADPSDRVDVLALLDESSYEGGTMGASHPIAWAQEYDGGRAFYTAGGHTSASYAEPSFLSHLRGGILWAGRRAD